MADDKAIRWDSETITKLLVALLLAFLAWRTESTNGKVDARAEALTEQNRLLNERLKWSQEQQYQTRLDLRMLEEARMGGHPSGRAVPPPPPKE